MRALRAAFLIAIFQANMASWCQIVVTQLTANAGATKAGLQQGDVVSRWRRGPDGGEIRDPFDLSILEAEMAGSVTLGGTRGTSEQEWIVKDNPWALTTAPSLNGIPPAAYLEGQRLYTAGQSADAAAVWEKAAEQVTGTEAVWLLSRAAETYAAASQWGGSDRALAAALQRTTPEPNATIQLERMWANTFYQRNAWEQAKTHYDRALSEAERISNRGASATISYEIGRLYIDRRQPEQSLPYLRRSLEIRRELAPESAPFAQVVNSLGRAFLTSGDLKSAQQYFEQSLGLYERLAPLTAPVASALHNLGIVALEREDLDSADEYFKRSLEITVKLTPNGVQWANTATSLANIARERGDFVLAELYLEKVLAIRRKLQPDSLFLSSALNGLGNLHKARGELVLAESEYREALAISSKLAPGSREIAGTLENLGDIAELRNDWELARDNYLQSKQIWDKIAPGTLFWAKAIADLAQALEHFGKFGEAERQYRTVLHAFEENKAAPLSVARVTEALGELQERRGQFKVAAQSYTNAFNSLALEIPGSLAVSAATLHLADLARHEHQWGTAQDYYQKSLSISETLIPNSDEVARASHGMALVAEHLGRKSAAASFFSRSLAALENAAPEMGGSEQSQAVIRANYAAFYQDYMLFLSSENRPEDAFTVLERSRARALLQMLAERDFTSKDIPAELDLERHKNAVDYDRVQEQITGLSPENDKAKLTTLHGRLLELTAERASTVEKIKRASPSYAELRYPAPLDLEGVQAALDPGTVLVSFAVTPQRTLVFVVRPKGLQPAIKMFSIPVRETELREKVVRFRRAIDARTFASQTAVSQEGSELYNLLLRPVESLLSSTGHLLIVPDGPLDSLPFEALRRSSTQYLVEWKPSHTALSVSLYSQLKQMRRSPESYRLSLAAFGDATYQTGNDPQHVSPAAAELRAAVQNGLKLRPLQFSRTEVEQIAGFFPESKEIFLGQDATEEHAKSIGKDVRYIHFSVHGLLDRELPLNSALVFSRPEGSENGKENGLLQAWELYAGVRWDADLVVVSSCQSALGEEFAGEGSFGLMRAVHYAGAHSVIAALWSVDDQATQQLMTDLYRHLREGQTKDEALRSAQMELLATPAWASPYYWAGFVLSGDWK